MIKTELSRKQKTMREKKELNDEEVLIVKKHDPFKHLLDIDNLVRAIRECIEENDPEGLIEVIEIYLDALEKSKFLRKAKIPLVAALDTSKSSNPKINTLIKVVRMDDFHSSKAVLPK